MARGSITRSSAAAALVVTALLAVVLWERNVRPGTERSTSALHPPRLDPAAGEPAPPVAAHPGEPMKGRSVTRTGAKESEPGAAQDGLLAPLGTTPSPDGGAAPRRR